MHAPVANQSEHPCQPACLPVSLPFPAQPSRPYGSHCTRGSMYREKVRCGAVRRVAVQLPYRRQRRSAADGEVGTTAAGRGYHVRRLLGCVCVCVCVLVVSVPACGVARVPGCRVPGVGVSGGVELSLREGGAAVRFSGRLGGTPG